MYKLYMIFMACLPVLCSSYEPPAANVPLAVIQSANVPLAAIQPAKVQIAATQQTEQQGDQLRNIQIINDIKTFMHQNPHLRLIRLNKKTPVNHRSESVKYTLGNRVSGDKLVAQYADTFFYPALKDVSTQVTYPETGTGSIITSVDINCLQHNADGNAYVVAGGIGQRFISIVLEATQTERFTYNVHFYGKD